MEQHQLEDQYDHFRKEQPINLTDAKRSELTRLASDVPGIWRAEGTTIQDRQEIVRLLIERIEVSSRGRTEWVDVVVRWAGGAELLRASLILASIFQVHLQYCLVRL